MHQGLDEESDEYDENDLEAGENLIDADDDEDADEKVAFLRHQPLPRVEDRRVLVIRLARKAAVLSLASDEIHKGVEDQMDMEQLGVLIQQEYAAKNELSAAKYALERVDEGLKRAMSLPGLKEKQREMMVLLEEDSKEEAKLLDAKMGEEELKELAMKRLATQSHRKEFSRVSTLLKKRQRREFGVRSSWIILMFDFILLCALVQLRYGDWWYAREWKSPLQEITDLELIHLNQSVEMFHGAVSGGVGFFTVDGHTINIDLKDCGWIKWNTSLVGLPPPHLPIVFCRGMKALLVFNYLATAAVSLQVLHVLLILGGFLPLKPTRWFVKTSMILWMFVGFCSMVITSLAVDHWRVEPWSLVTYRLTIHGVLVWRVFAKSGIRWSRTLVLSILLWVPNILLGQCMWILCHSLLRVRLGRQDYNMYCALLNSMNNYFQWWLPHPHLPT